jgi:hypothetical protein
MTENDELASPTVSSGGNVQPTDTYDSKHGKYADQQVSVKPQSHGSQTSHVKSSFSFRGR